MKAKAKKTPMCSVSLIAIELKGLAAPGEALKINRKVNPLIKEWTANAASPLQNGRRVDLISQHCRGFSENVLRKLETSKA